jgi:hypothetical protein
MGEKEKTLVARTTAAVIVKVLEIAKRGDAKGVGDLLRKRCDLMEYLGSADNDREMANLQKVPDNLVDAYHVYKKQKNKAMSKALLSLLAPTDTIHKISELVSVRVQVAAGKLVSFFSSGHSKVEGVVVSVDGSSGTCDIDVYERSEAMKRKRFVITEQEADEVFAGMKKTGFVLSG